MLKPMEAKYFLLIGLVVANIPLYRLIFLLLFKKAAGGEALTVKRLFDPVFLKDAGGEMKLFLLLIASALAVLIEYFSLLSIFPGLVGPTSL